MEYFWNAFLDDQKNIIIPYLTVCTKNVKEPKQKNKYFLKVLTFGDIKMRFSYPLFVVCLLCASSNLTEVVKNQNKLVSSSKDVIVEKDRDLITSQSIAPKDAISFATVPQRYQFYFWKTFLIAVCMYVCMYIWMYVFIWDLLSASTFDNYKYGWIN